MRVQKNAERERFENQSARTPSASASTRLHHGSTHFATARAMTCKGAKAVLVCKHRRAWADTVGGAGGRLAQYVFFSAASFSWSSGALAECDGILYFWPSIPPI
mmetsp:Transcript_52057/g.103596  ORF Transcript_52057/g.103596 Transcript_52057/m.103596 type:complete len:104 (-) Transcript_52057:76-387(-)